MSLLTLAILWPLRNLVITGANDFLSFYAGARLAGTSDLYNPAQAQRVQFESADTSSQTLPFIRLPYFAAFLWPLGKLPYLAAYACWQILNGIAFLLFLRLWPLQPVWAARFLACSCLGIGWSFANAQDHTFLLLWIAASLYLLRQETHSDGQLSLVRTPYGELWMPSRDIAAAAGMFVDRQEGTYQPAWSLGPVMKLTKGAASE
ncbi:MAG: DUF2029 domain-containing protein [Acidobacteriia bacterium]|nr:DUF2029 domain-containing protein [Terriglobia bacterium]